MSIARILKKLLWGVAVLAGMVAMGFWLAMIRPYVQAKQARLAAPYLEVRSDLAGRLTYAPYGEGDCVEKGDVLFSLNNFEEKQRQKSLEANVNAIQQKLSNLLADVEKMTAAYIVARRDSDLGMISTENAEQCLTLLQEDQRKANDCKEILAAAQAKLNEASQIVEQKSVVAPFSGVIVKRQKREGDLLAYGDAVYALCDPGRIWVDVVIPERQIAKVAVGQTAFIYLAGEKFRRWEGVVSWVSPVALPSKKGVEARVSLKQGNGPLPCPNCCAKVKIKIH